MSPKLSVIIPCYNRKRFVKECLESVLASSLKEIEVILVDDGSTDGTYELAQRLARKDKRVHVLPCEEHRGAYEARWVGLAIAKGEYVHFMDSDDVIAPDAYERLYAIASENNLDTLIFMAEPFISEAHTPTEARIRDKFTGHYRLDESCCGKVLDGAEMFSLLSEKRSFFVGFPMRFCRRNLLNITGAPACKAYWHGDNYYSVVWLFESKRAMAIGTPFYKRRCHRKSITMARNAECLHFKSILSVMLSLCDYAPFMEFHDGKPARDYLFRLIRSLERHGRKIPDVEVGIAVREVVELHAESYAMFAHHCFLPLLHRWSILCNQKKMQSEEETSKC